MKYLIIEDLNGFSIKTKLSQEDLDDCAGGNTSIIKFEKDTFFWAEVSESEDSEDGETPTLEIEWHPV
tara:strand:+ start:571 stop:774 length:204 start_codon:yes stop_codon:yes gene_type:complete